jgi:nitrite reductase/ring-hydroxylating ferredoxin subunit
MIHRKLPVCRIDELKPGTIRSFRFGISDGIAYNDAGTIKAYVNRCTHMGGPVELRGHLLQCRWHESAFDPCSGCRVSGQAPEGTALTPIELVIEGDQVWAILEIQDEFE